MVVQTSIRLLPHPLPSAYSAAPVYLTVSSKLRNMIPKSLCTFLASMPKCAGGGELSDGVMRARSLGRAVAAVCENCDQE